MGGLVKAMLKGAKCDAYTQVDDGELSWFPKDLIGHSSINS